jgi:hypothetical protein
MVPNHRRPKGSVVPSFILLLILSISTGIDASTFKFFKLTILSSDFKPIIKIFFLI